MLLFSVTGLQSATARNNTKTSQQSLAWGARFCINENCLRPLPSYGGQVTRASVEWRQVGGHIAHVHAVSERHSCFARVPLPASFFAVENTRLVWTYPTHCSSREHPQEPLLSLELQREHFLPLAEHLRRAQELSRRKSRLYLALKLYS